MTSLPEVMTRYLLIATAIINTLSGAIAAESYSFIQHHEPNHHSSYNSPFVSHSHYSEPASQKYGITPDQHSHYYAYQSINMTSLPEVLEIINSDLDAERNESIGTSIHERNSKLKNVQSRNNEVDVSEKTADVTSEDLVPRNINFENTKSEQVQIFEKIFALFMFLGKCFGIYPTYYWIPEKSFAFCLCICLLVYTWLCIFYTQCIHINNGENLRVLEACAIYGIASSCTQKLLGYLQKRHLILSIFSCIQKMCRQIVCDNQANILKSDLQKTFTFLKVYIVGVAFCLGFFTASPFKSYIVDKELMSLLPLEIVFVDQSTLLGFAIANAVMTVMGLFAVLGTILYGAVFIFAIRVHTLQVNLIGQDFKDLDEMWADGSAVPLRQKQLLLRNICKKQQDIKNYMSIVNDIFERKFFFYFCFNYFSQIICLFEITKNQWLPGYGVALNLFIEMMFYCVMGSQITIADDKLCASIYATDWYRYDLSSRKLILLLLHRSQQSNELNLGPLGPLNVITGIEVVKSIYSYYTVLTELL